MQSSSTPLRQRQRGLSPESTVARSQRAGVLPAAEFQSTGPWMVRRQNVLPDPKGHASQDHVRPKNKRWPLQLLAVLAFIFSVLVGGCISALLSGTQHSQNHSEPGVGTHLKGSDPLTDMGTAASDKVASVSEQPLATTAQVTPPPDPQLHDLLLSIISSRSPVRAAALDVLEGVAPDVSHGKDDLQRFLRGIAKVGHIDKAGNSEGDHELRDAALRLADSAKRWPATLYEQTVLLMAKSMQAAAACDSGGVPAGGNDDVQSAPSVKLVIDPQFTSPAASVDPPSFALRTLLRIWSVIGVHRERVASYRSKPAEVVVDSKSASAPGDCLALRADATVALRVVEADGRTSSAPVSHVVIEQLPRGERTQRPRSAPRRFTVYGDVMPASAGVGVNFSGCEPSANGSTTTAVQGHIHPIRESPYSMPLGSFEYLMAAPAAQAFRLLCPAAVRGLRFSFEDVGWGEAYICVYRLRAYGRVPPACIEVANPILPAL